MNSNGLGKGDVTVLRYNHLVSTCGQTREAVVTATVGGGSVGPSVGAAGSGDHNAYTAEDSVVTAVGIGICDSYSTGELVGNGLVHNQSAVGILLNIYGNVESDEAALRNGKSVYACGNVDKAELTGRIGVCTEAEAFVVKRYATAFNQRCSSRWCPHRIRSLDRRRKLSFGCCCYRGCR